MRQAIANTAQAKVWNGEDGTRWADRHHRYDAMAEGFNHHLMRAAGIGDTSRVLDIGCGTGHTTRLAARQANRGHATGIDLSAPMLDRARQIAADQRITNATFLAGDAQVHPFPAAAFDAAISRAGVMFFADPVAAFGNVRRALRPGGRLTFLTHSHVSQPFLDVYRALADHISAEASKPGQESGVGLFADPGQVRAILVDAGFRQTAATPVEILSTIGRDADDATNFLLSGPLSPMLRHTDPATLDRARTAVQEVLHAHESNGAVRLPAHGWLYATTRDRGCRAHEGHR